ncbi:electron transporter SenC [Kouleothrix aurantiaca]|uniref:Electron transporter SenC n=1 Tax=Kouleothrix aurantiaca TaxID=186479 RepID=A0A0P9FDG0_9CHLR|nr:electron transporter SenC [Kouleothrix aurantiaca]
MTFPRHLRVLTLLLAIVLGACGAPYAFHGTVLEPLSQAPDFTLTDQNGQPFRLSDQRGKVILMFFGFTSCPDVCPTTLGDLKVVRNRLGADADKTQVVMVTVDPARDTHEQLQTYMAKFDPSFLGLRGSQEELKAIYRAYGVTAIRRELTSDLSVDHSSYIYVIDQSGRWRLLLRYGTPIEDVASDIRYLVRNEGI